MNNQITYADQVAVNQNSNIPDINKVNASDMNEIKAKHNGVMNGSIPMGNVVVDSIRSKNMFDKNAVITPGYLDNSGNLVTTDATLSCGNVFIPVKPSTTYTISSSSSTVYRIAYYNSSKTFISRIFNDNASLNYTFTTPSNASYIKMAGTLTSVLNSLQIEEGSTATSYSPYQELNNQEIYSTGEVKIGTWIDGKPLYREVVVLSSITVGSVVSATLESLGITNINNIFINVSKSFIINSSNETRPLIGAINTSNISYAYLTNTRLYRYCTDNNLNGTWTICLEYTKTTD